jgi:hypothetical protein
MEVLKRCVTCKQMLLLTAFNKRKRSKDGLQFRCRDCFRKWYEANREPHKKNVQDRVRRIRGPLYERLHEYFLDHPCVDCGDADPLVLEFDHVSDDKTKDVSKLVLEGYSWKTIEAEIAKCEVVCCNCHRRRTHLRANTVRARWLDPADAG